MTDMIKTVREWIRGKVIGYSERRTWEINTETNVDLLCHHVNAYNVKAGYQSGVVLVDGKRRQYPGRVVAIERKGWCSKKWEGQ